MAQIFDVIEYANEMENEIVHRFPDNTTDGAYRLGSNVIVRDGQKVVFFRDGLALDVFGPGRHIIATANVPLLTQKVQDLFGFDSELFTAPLAPRSEHTATIRLKVYRFGGAAPLTQVKVAF